MDTSRGSVSRFSRRFSPGRVIIRKRGANIEREAWNPRVNRINSSRVLTVCPYSFVHNWPCTSLAIDWNSITEDAVRCRTRGNVNS